MHNVVERLMAIQSEIKELLIKNNSQNKDLNIIIVCKTFSMDKILPLIDAGHVHFGENKVQEAELKWKEIKKNIQILSYTWSASYRQIKSKQL